MSLAVVTSALVVAALIWAMASLARVWAWVVSACFSSAVKPGASLIAAVFVVNASLTVLIAAVFVADASGTVTFSMFAIPAAFAFSTA
ncbi:hypothetical protein [Limosilactobacillus antri]|uniref:hypothetical protein n=1 Tax=Limosilactobacillus antri TaxID=227943 RepID=UPI0005907325